MKAIVLSGGGAKGAYQVGVWKALRSMNHKFDIVTGSSIGALNGMFMAQNQYYRCLSLWRQIDFKFLFNDFNIGKNDKDIYKEYFNKALKGGIKTKKMEDILDKYYNPNKLYNSNIKYGVSLYNLTTKKNTYITTKNTRPDKLKDYIVGSASCYPVFEPKKIQDITYIDGGYSDNMPINLAIELGATDIIAVDLGAIGVVKKNPKKANITVIKPKSKLDSFLMFEQNRIGRMMSLGYNDTMKMFKKYEGDLYTFKKGTSFFLINRMYTNFNKLLKKYKIEKTIDKKGFLSFIETVMEIFELDVTGVYSLRKLNNDLNSAFKKTENTTINIFDIDKIKKIFKKKVIVKNIYTKLINGEKLHSATTLFFQTELLVAIYMKTIKNYL